MSRFAPAGESDFESGSEDDCFEFFEPEKNGNKAAVICTMKAKETFSVMPALDHANEKNAPSPFLINDLQTAITVGEVEAVKHLTKGCSDLDMILKSGWSLLMHAAYFSKVEIVEYLLEIGADVHAANAVGDTALHAACKSSAADNSMTVLHTVKALLKAGANILGKDISGKVPIMYAARRNLVDVVDALLEMDAKAKSLSVQDDKGWTVADWAAVYGHIEILQLLINLGMNIDKNLPSFQLWPEEVVKYVEEKTTLNDSMLCQTMDENLHVQVEEDNEVTSLPTNKAFEKEVQSWEATSSTPEQNINSDTVTKPISQPLDSVPNNGGETNEILGDPDEAHCLPAIVTQEKLQPEEYATYGQLELFLLGLDLVHLIPLFKEQDVKFEQLLCLTTEELETIGITAFGTRKRIVAAIHECHEKHTKTTNVSDHTKTPLNLENLLSMMSGASEQVEYIGSCLQYIKHHIDIYPDTLKPVDGIKYDQSPISSYLDKVKKVNASLCILAKALKHLKCRAEDLEKAALDAQYTPPGMVPAVKRSRTISVAGKVILRFSLLFAAFVFCRRLRAISF